MTVVSLSFYILLAISLFAYYLFPKKYQWCVLLVSSVLFFCFAGTPWTILYPVISTVVTWYGGLKIQKYKSEKVKSSKIWLWVTLTVNLGILAALKYANFFLSNAGVIHNLFANTQVSWSTHWIAALGISFYTLQIIGYILDCYWDVTTAQTNVFKLALYTMFFPQMVSGPISRYNQLSKELYAEHKFDIENIRSGVIRIILGTFKKLVLAENIAIILPKIFDVKYGKTGPIAFIGMILYVIQIYADFAGCMDIVIGAAHCFGVKMVENFNFPFSSRSIQEFWQRWHITLGLWLRDYIMYPLLRSKAWLKLTKSCKKKFGKKIAKKVPTHLAMLVLWFCMGLWHGGWWNFILEGIWFWAVIVIGDWCSPLFKKITSKFNNENKLWICFQRLRTILIYSIGAIMFKSASVAESIKMLRNIFSPFWILDLSPIYSIYDSLMISDGIIKIIIDALVMVFAFSVFCLENAFEKKGKGLDKALKGKPILFQIMCLCVVVYLILLFGVYGPGYNAADFIYGGF